MIIFSSQVKDFLGLRMGAVPADFVEKWRAFATHLDSIEPAGGRRGRRRRARDHRALAAGQPRVPGPFVALIVTTALAYACSTSRSRRSAARFGGIDAALPRPRCPHVTLAAGRGAGRARRSRSRCSAAIESLLSAVVADGMIGGRHRSNMELVAQGVANIASPLFGGIPATGAIARTATNVKNGGRTPVAGIVHALTLLLITLFFGRWAALIPMATLAAILVVVAYHMSEWRTFRAELRSPKSDVAVLLATFALTVLVDLTVAIEVGMVLAAFLFMRRMAEVTNVSALTREFLEPTMTDERDPELGRAPDGPAGGRGVRDQRPVLLRRGRDVQGHAVADRRQAARADHPHAPRAGDRLDGAPRVARGRRAVPAGGHAGGAVRRARAAGGGVSAGGDPGDDRRGEPHRQH